MDVADLPFNKFLGLTIDRDHVELLPQEHHANHQGTIHAAVIFGVAEAASAQRLLREFPDVASRGAGVLRSSTVKFRRPASLDACLLATGEFSGDEAHKFRAQYASRGRAVLAVSVVVKQASVEVFTGVFKWFAVAAEG